MGDRFHGIRGTQETPFQGDQPPNLMKGSDRAWTAQKDKTALIRRGGLRENFYVRNKKVDIGNDDHLTSDERMQILPSRLEDRDTWERSVKEA